ncbi:MAG: PilZ domain-containing protein [Acidobacteriaceae bacterium]|nr:PilZ domain-containing protein [Acidobacteriaceae bacterium]
MTPTKSWFERLWSEERRQAERRASLPLLAYYWDGAEPKSHPVRNISPEGMYLLTDQRWYPNTLLSMTLTRTDKTEADPYRAIRLTARVVRSGSDGVGMAFLLPDSRQSENPTGYFPLEADADTVTEFIGNLLTNTNLGVAKLISLTLLVLGKIFKAIQLEDSILSPRQF